MSASILIDSRENIDVEFLFTKHPISSNVAIKKKTNAIKQSVLHLLQLKSGDKPFHPEIKSPIYDYLFESASAVVQVVLESEIMKYLGVYEPRLIVTKVSVSFPSSNDISVTVYGVLVNTREPITINTLVSRVR